MDDYPYGFGQQCTIRYWLHTATRGSAAGKVRLMSQTTDPRAPGERWNTPKASTYAPWAVLIEDSRGRVTWWPVPDRGPEPWQDLTMRVRRIYDQLDDHERDRYTALLNRSQGATYRNEWERMTRAYELLGADVTRDELRNEHHIHLDERDHQVLAAAWADGLEL